MLPRKNHRQFTHGENKDEPSTMEADKPDPHDNDHEWCENRNNKWTRMLRDVMKDEKHPTKLLDLFLIFTRCAIRETNKIRQAFVKFAREGMGIEDIEDNLKDYDECMVPKFIPLIYEKMNSYALDFAIIYPFPVGQYFFYAFKLMISNGCSYHKELLKDAKVADGFCRDMVCMLYRANKFLKFTPSFFSIKKPPDYVTKDPGNTIPFIRDYLIIRDFIAYCENFALLLAYIKRKLTIEEAEKNKKTR